jgi:hypothetical protein
VQLKKTTTAEKIQIFTLVPNICGTEKVSIVRETTELSVQIAHRVLSGHGSLTKPEAKTQEAYLNSNQIKYDRIPQV